MEISFETWWRCNVAIHFKECGKKMEQLTKLMKIAVKTMMNAEYDILCDCWLNQLINTVTADGAWVQPQSGIVGILKCKIQVNEELSMRAGVHPAKHAKVSTSIIEIDSDSDSHSLSDPDVPLSRWALIKTCMLGQFKQTKLLVLWQPCFSEELRNQMAKSRKTEEVERQKVLEREKKVKAKKKTQECMLAWNCQREHCERKKAELEDDRDDVNKVLMAAAENAEEASTLDHNVAAILWSGHEDWKKLRNSRQDGTKQEKATYINWYYPFLWKQIHKAMCWVQ